MNASSYLRHRVVVARRNGTSEMFLQNAIDRNNLPPPAHIRVPRAIAKPRNFKTPLARSKVTSSAVPSVATSHSIRSIDDDPQQNQSEIESIGACQSDNVAHVPKVRQLKVVLNRIENEEVAAALQRVVTLRPIQVVAAIQSQSTDTKKETPTRYSAVVSPRLRMALERPTHQPDEMLVQQINNLRIENAGLKIEKEFSRKKYDKMARQVISLQRRLIIQETGGKPSRINL